MPNFTEVELLRQAVFNKNSRIAELEVQLEILQEDYDTLEKKHDENETLLNEYDSIQEDNADLYSRVADREDTIELLRADVKEYREQLEHLPSKSEFKKVFEMLSHFKYMYNLLLDRGVLPRVGGKL